MEFDNLIFFLFFILVAVINILKTVFKNKKKAQTPQPAKETKKKTSILGQLAETIKKELEKAEKAAQLEKQGPLGNQGVLVDEDFSGLEMVEDVEELDLYDPTDSHQDVLQRHELKPAPKISEVKADKIVDRMTGEKPRYNRNQLRNAIIMAEILAPPVALRDEKMNMKLT